MPAHTRSYRCHYHPKDRDSWPVPCETGVLPFVQVKAANAEAAQRQAHIVTGCPISNVERLEVDELLERVANKASPRRFTGEPITAFGALA